MNKKLFSIVVVVSILSITPMFSQESASAILSKAMEKAKIENKNVFIMFHASWCGWCKKMDKNMKNKACNTFFDKNYVFEHLVVNEATDKKHLENPGAEALLAKYKGETAGIPFWLIFDKNGNFLADSFDGNGQNLGCPVSKEEVSVFIEKLKRTSTLTQKELDVISAVFQGV